MRVARAKARLLLVASLAGCLDAPPGSTGGEPLHSLQFFGHPLQDNGVDRLWIPAERPSPAGRIGRDDFTLELWLATSDAASVPEGGCYSLWFQNTIVLDREFYFDPPQNGNIGLAVYRSGTGSGVAAGFEVGDVGEVNLCGDAPVLDGAWHHIAFVRDADGVLSLWVDGVLDEMAAGPLGDGSMAAELVDIEPADRFMVLGGPKHPADMAGGFAGYIDDLRLSDDDLYDQPFDPPYPPLAIDPDDTMALWTFDEGEGTTVSQRAGDGTGEGELRVGGSPAGPLWSDDVPTR